MIFLRGEPVGSFVQIREKISRMMSESALEVAAHINGENVAMNINSALSPHAAVLQVQTWHIG